MAKKIKAELREKKKRQKMIISGKSVFTLAKIISNKAEKRRTWPRTNLVLRQKAQRLFNFLFIPVIIDKKWFLNYKLTRKDTKLVRGWLERLSVIVWFKFYHSDFSDFLALIKDFL